jgi:mRNA interferase MazF
MPQADADAPDAGDIVWVEFGPPFGHEQAGRRPALVVSSKSYNDKSSLIVICPITRSQAPWPFKVEMPQVGQIRGAVMADQIRSIDRRARVVRLPGAGQVPNETLDRVYATIASLLGIPVSN